MHVGDRINNLTGYVRRDIFGNLNFHVFYGFYEFTQTHSIKIFTNLPSKLVKLKQADVMDDVLHILACSIQDSFFFNSLLINLILNASHLHGISFAIVFIFN